MTTSATIRVDDEHMALERSDGSEAPRYQIPPVTSLIVDTTGYEFFVPPNLTDVDGPSSVQLVITGSGEHWAVRFVAGQTRYVLDQSTLQPLPGSPPFTGLRAGQKGVLGIGHASDDRLEELHVLWFGMFDVVPG